MVVILKAIKKRKWYLPNFIKFPLKVPWKMEVPGEIEETPVTAMLLEAGEEKMLEQL